MSTTNIENYDMMLDALSAIGVRVTQKEISEIFDFDEDEETFFLYGEEKGAFIRNKDGRMNISYDACNSIQQHNQTVQIIDIYGKLIYALIEKKKLTWTNLEIDRLVLKFNEKGYDGLTALSVGNRAGEIFEEMKDFDIAMHVYRINARYCEKNNLTKDIFVECVLHLCKVEFLRGITSLETVKLQERTLELVSDRNCTYNDAILMIYTGINQTNIYRDTDGAEMRTKGLQILKQFDDTNRKDDSMFAKAWSYSWSGDVEKIISLYEDLIVLIEKNQIETMSPFLYLPIIFAYFYLGEYSKALVITEILYKSAVEKHDSQAAAMMLSVLGRAHVYMNNLDIAESFLYKALEESTLIGYDWARYYTLIALSLFHYKRRNVLGCLEALELSDEMSKEKNLGNIQNSPFILDVFKFIDESGKTSSLQSYDDKIDSVLRSTNKLMRGVALRHDAERKIRTNRTASEIINTFQQSIELLTKTGSVIEIGDSQMGLARYLLSIGNKESAVKFAQRAYENLYISAEERFPSDLLCIVNRSNSSVNVQVKLEVLALELKHILDKEKLMARMIASLEKILHAECGAVAECRGTSLKIHFKENIVAQEDSERYREILADCAFSKETKRIASYKRTYNYQADKSENVVFSMLRSPSFRVAIPVMQEEECRAVIYVESYLRNHDLTAEERDALQIFSETISSHFYALMKKEEVEKRAMTDVSSVRHEEDKSFFSSTDSQIAEIDRLIEKVGMTDVPVLITGETGVGKEYFAKKVFSHSGYQKTFIKVNCGAIPESLLESELFGYEKGSFTGASQTKIGYFEAANGGTVFLDEIGELPLYAQTKLLRVLQEKTIMRVGSVVETKVNFRLIAATNRNLEREVENGTFRQDLLYRINLIPLSIPALRNRKNDIIDFSKFFLERYCKELGIAECRFSEDAIRWMLDYDWPGNVREMENVIHRAVLMTDKQEIDITHMQPKIKNDKPSRHIDSLEEVERKHIIKALEMCNGKIGGKGGAADLLGIKRTTLNSKIEKLGIKKYL